VTVHEIGIDVGSIKVGAPPHGAENGAQRLWATEIAGINLVAGDPEIAFFNALIAKATNFHRHHLRQFARKIADVNTRTAVDVRRIFVGEKKNFHERP
jgi:hypothetical protein